MLAAVLAALALTGATPSHIAFSASRTPTSFGEIYRVAPNGAVTNLTHNPAADVDPSVSPNGKLVAFARLRAKAAQMYVVGTDGRGLHAVSPPIPGAGLHDGAAITIAWSPDNRHFSVLRTSTSTVTLALDSTTGGYRSVARGLSAARAAWSHDGRRIAVSTAAGLVDVLDSSPGRLLWKVAGQGTSDWSSHGLLAVHAASDRIVVYDASGHK